MPGVAVIASEAARPVSPFPPSAGQPSVNRGTEGQGFDALVRNHDAQLSALEAGPQTDGVVVSTGVRAALNAGISPAPQPMGALGSGMLTAFQQDVPSLPGSSAKPLPVVGQASIDAGMEQAFGDAAVAQASGDAGVEQPSANAGVEQASVNTGVKQAIGPARVQQLSDDRGVEQVSGDAGVEQPSPDANAEQASVDAGVKQATSGAGVEQLSDDTGVARAFVDAGVEQSSDDTRLERTSADADVKQASNGADVEQAPDDADAEQAFDDAGVEPVSDYAGAAWAKPLFDENSEKKATVETAVNIGSVSLAADLQPVSIEQLPSDASGQTGTDRPSEKVDSDSKLLDKGNLATSPATSLSRPALSHPPATALPSDVLPIVAAPAGTHAAMVGMGPTLPVVGDAAGSLAAPPPASASPSGSASVANLVPDLAVEVARNAAIGREEFLVRLRPADHGTILVRLQFQDDGPLRATITADNMAVLDMLRRDSDALASNLSNAGVQTDTRSFRFFGGDGGQSGGRDPRPAFSTTRASDPNGSSDDTMDEAMVLYRPLRARAGLVNRLA